MSSAFQSDAFQSDVFQSAPKVIGPAFQGNAFQGNAFQAESVGSSRAFHVDLRPVDTEDDVAVIAAILVAGPF